MKKIIFILLLIFLFPVTGETKTQYIIGLMKVTFRTGPGEDHRVLAMIKTGQAVEILVTEADDDRDDANTDEAPGKDWTHVRLPNGKEGWVLSRFLTDKEPFSVAFDQAKQKNEKLALQLEALLEESEKQKNTNSRLESEFTKNKNKFNELKKSYETLKKESSEFLKLKTDYKKTAAALAADIKKTGKIETELSRMRLQKNIKWFLSGAGVLVLGFLLGLSARRQHRRSSLR